MRRLRGGETGISGQMMADDFPLPERAKILVIVCRRLGDVLLATPLVRTLRHGYGNAVIDVLVFRGTEGMLAGNPDIASVITVSTRPSLVEIGALVRRLWRRYDLAISTQAGDRPTFLAFIAGRHRIGLVPTHGGRWKRLALHQSVRSDADNHRIPELMRLTDILGLAQPPEIVCPATTAVDVAFPGGRYAVLHANPMFRYRRWSDAGWRKLAGVLAGRGLTVVATGGPSAPEKSYLDNLWNPADVPVLRLDGRLDWGQLTKLLRGAAVYIGPDTSMTHLAAGAGCPTIALYGPASPHRIGPWPVGGLEEMWAPAGTIQHRGNVWVVQNPLPCLPCEKLGCEGHLDSFSQCLDELSVHQVLAAVDQALAARRTSPPLASSA